MPFQPLNEEHAVAICQFAIGLNRSVSAANLLALQRAHSRWAQILPAGSAVSLDDFDGDYITPSLAPRTNSAFVAAFLRPDGSPVWSLRVFSNQIDVLCTRYTRWDTTWPTAREIIQHVAAAIASAEKDTRILAVGLKVVDRFLTTEGYDLKELFSNNSWVLKRLFGVGDYWHSHLGWFEPEGEHRILNQLDFDAQNDSGREKGITISLTHTGQHRFKRGADEALTPFDQKGVEVVDRSMTMLHKRNKALLLDVLTPDMADRVGLGKGV